MKAKRLITMLLCVALILSTFAIALAADETPADGTGGTPPEGMEGMGPPPDGEGGMPPEGMEDMGPPPDGGEGGAPSEQAAETAVTGDFIDAASIKNKAAVNFMVGLGLINGIQNDDGTYSYKPEDNIDRSAMAKIIAMATVLGGGEIKSDGASFNDTEGTWAESYIEYCSENGIINGMGDGSFAPKGSVTGYQTAKMLLAAMGDKDLTGDDWKAATKAAADEKGILEGLDIDLDTAISRDDAALMIYNALMASDGTGMLPYVQYFAESAKGADLEIKANSILAAPEGMKIYAVKDDAWLDTTVPGTYTGVDVYVVENIGAIIKNDLDYRAALYVDDKGVAESKSMSALLSAGEYTATAATDVALNSKLRNLNGIIVAGTAKYTISGLKVDVSGSGSNDFQARGAIVTVCDDAEVVIENAEIKTEGVVRTGIVVAENGKLLVKDSTISTKDGDMAADFPSYIPTVDTSAMKSVPWMLGLTGNNRATNLLGKGIVTYYNSTIQAEKWGVLSTDENTGVQLAAVNSLVEITGESGYGSYAIGDTQVKFLGATINVPDYALICANGASGGTFAPSSAENLKDVYGMDGLTVEEKVTTVNSERFGVMYHSGAGKGVTYINGGTIFNTKLTTFLVKGCGTSIVVDNATLNPANGVILQVMDNDDAGIDTSTMGCTKDYVQPEGAAVLREGRDVTVATEGTDVFASFSNMTLTGDIFNSSGYTDDAAAQGDNSLIAGSSTSAKNLSVTMSGVTFKGLISASEATHVDLEGKPVTTIQAPEKAETGGYTTGEYWLIGILSNEAKAAVNNGVIVSLEKTTWDVTGSSYLTSLTIGEGVTINGKLTVDGVETAIAAGTYTGAIVVSAK